MLRIGYDARFAVNPYRGMGTLVRHAVANSAAEFIGLCATGESDTQLNVVGKGLRLFPLWEQISIPRRARELRLDYFLAPYNTAPLWLPLETPLIMIVHDLIFMEPFSRLSRSPSLRQNLGRLYRRLVVPLAIPKAEIILTVSEFTKSEIVSQLPIDPARVKVIPSSIPNSWYAKSPTPLHERSNYMLCIGGEAPSKNVRKAIESYALARQTLRRKCPDLWIGGINASARQPFADSARDAGIAQHVKFLPYLSCEELQSIYRQAMLVLIPSLREGFGLPLLEAMASGTPVVSSNLTSLPEVGGDAPLYTSPENIAEMATVIAQVVSDPELWTNMISRGISRAAEFYEITKRMYSQFWTELAQGTERSEYCN